MCYGLCDVEHLAAAHSHNAIALELRTGTSQTPASTLGARPVVHAKHRLRDAFASRKTIINRLPNAPIGPRVKHNERTTTQTRYTSAKMSKLPRPLHIPSRSPKYHWHATPRFHKKDPCATKAQGSRNG